LVHLSDENRRRTTSQGLLGTLKNGLLTDVDSDL
jgi:hypothetical protein